METYVVVLLSLLACVSTSPTKKLHHKMSKGKTNMEPELHMKLMRVSRRLNKFSFDMQKELSKSAQGNVVFSPFSIFTALSMLGIGAKGDTLKQISKVLNWGDEKLTEDMKAWYDEISNEHSDGASISVANKAWVSQQLKLVDSYQSTLKKIFLTEIGKEAFESDPEGALKNINEWVSQETNGKIEDLFPSGAINSMTKLVLANAIYFKGKWVEEFDPKLTCHGAFHLGDEREHKHMEKEDEEHEEDDDHEDDDDDDHSDEEEDEEHKECRSGHNGAHSENHAEVSFMTVTHTFRYYSDCENEAHILELPYVGGQFAMLLALPMTDPKKFCKKTETSPASKSRLENLAEKVETPSLDIWMGELTPARIKLSLPKFEVKQTVDLVSYLKKLGMRDVFTREADLSGVNGEKGLYVSAAMHKTFVKVDEGGTEAASATGIGMMPMSLDPFKPLVLKFNRPFLFYVVHKSCNAIVFSGKLLNPNA